jgi:hypothetical protein
LQAKIAFFKEVPHATALLCRAFGAQIQDGHT